MRVRFDHVPAASRSSATTGRWRAGSRQPLGSPSSPAARLWSARTASSSEMRAARRLLSRSARSSRVLRSSRADAPRTPSAPLQRGYSSAKPRKQDRGFSCPLGPLRRACPARRPDQADVHALQRKRGQLVSPRCRSGELRRSHPRLCTMTASAPLVHLAGARADRRYPTRRSRVRNGLVQWLGCSDLTGMHAPYGT